MEKTIKGSQTEKNLLKAFAGESQAARRYRLFAQKAREDGYEQIAAFFEETANQEDSHSRMFFKFLEGGMLEITATYPAGMVGTTAENLEASAEGENEEWTLLYPEFAKVAEEEGFKRIASTFKLIAGIELEHEKRYLKLLENLNKNQVFEKSEDIVWVCRHCGYHYKGKKALKNCPACEHPQAFFEKKQGNY
ncbi:MAG: rubrerythrin family protein [Bacteroidetes bacterium HGW-Bacteroidetes-9]|jgi:rubrerythrin|nr:MAG: rubrerythrin family protein [Bacteroidetes bacterium HGW-Bacteroidetes-9]